VDKTRAEAKKKGERGAGRADAPPKHTRSLENNAKALDAHSKSLMAATAITHALNREGVRKLLAQIWGVENPNDVKDVEPLTDYIAGGPAAILDFGNTLNLRIDGLHLTPGKLTGVTTVGSLIAAILRNLG
jgi:hypothetical protein